MQDTSLLALAGAIATVLCALLALVGQRLVAKAQESAASKQGEASVQVARIEADTTTQSWFHTDLVACRAELLAETKLRITAEQHLKSVLKECEEQLEQIEELERERDYWKGLFEEQEQ